VKWIAAVLVVGLLPPGCRSRAVSNRAADSTAVRAALEEYRQAWLKGDTAAALARISDDIRIMIGGIPDIVGKDATRKLFVDEMAKYEVPLLTLNHQDVIVSGDYVIDIGTFQEIQLPKTGAPIEGRGRFMTIWRREGSEWRIVRYMLN
jgi:ketosteroid isomerase-like protein